MSPSLSPSPSPSLLLLHPHPRPPHCHHCHCRPHPCPHPPCVLVPHSLLIPLPLTSLFPIPSSSLCPLHLCSPFPHCRQLAPVIHPMSSGLQGWGQVLGCSPLWYCGCGLTPATHCCIIHPMSSGLQQWPGWVWGVPSGCCLVIAELEPKKTKQNISYLKEDGRT